MMGAEIFNATPRSVAFNSLFATSADLHVRKLATFADLHSYTHALLFIRIAQWSNYHCFWFALHMRY